jgi:hypothetical protein
MAVICGAVLLKLTLTRIQDFGGFIMRFPGVYACFRASLLILYTELVTAAWRASNRGTNIPKKVSTSPP